VLNPAHVSIVSDASLAQQGSQYVEEDTAAWAAGVSSRYAGVTLPYTGSSVDASVWTWIGPASAVRVSWAGLALYDQAGAQIAIMRINSDGAIECINYAGGTASIAADAGRVGAWVKLRVGVDFLTNEVHYYLNSGTGDVLLDPSFGLFPRTHASLNFGKAELYAGRGTQGLGGSIIKFDGYAVTPGGSSCPADLDNGSGSGTHDGGVDINDLLYFLVQFESGSAAADLDNGTNTGTPDGGVDINDLLFFLVHFEAGC
jgi:hypothetical protein